LSRRRAAGSKERYKGARRLQPSVFVPAGTPVVADDIVLLPVSLFTRSDASLDEQHFVRRRAVANVTRCGIIVTAPRSFFSEPNY